MLANLHSYTKLSPPRETTLQSASSSSSLSSTHRNWPLELNTVHGGQKSEQNAPSKLWFFLHYRVASLFCSLILRTCLVTTGPLWSVDCFAVVSWQYCSIRRQPQQYHHLLKSHTLFENHRKGLIQHSEPSDQRLHFEWTKAHKNAQNGQFWRVFKTWS